MSDTDTTSWCSYLDHDAASNGQISVKPGVPNPPAVTLNPHLETALLRPLRPRLYLKYSDSLKWTSEKHVPLFILPHAQKTNPLWRSPSGRGCQCELPPWRSHFPAGSVHPQRRRWCLRNSWSESTKTKQKNKLKCHEIHTHTQLYIKVSKLYLLTINNPLFGKCEGY